MLLTPMFYESYIRNDKIPFVTSADKHSKEGLFSPDIFGYTERDKLFKYAFINLKCKVMAGGMLDIFKRIDGNFVKCCLFPTQQQYKIVSGKLVEASPLDKETGSGSEWLYHNWDKIDLSIYQSSGSKYANKEMKKALLKYSRDEYFTSYQYVMPVLYRDESSEPGAILYNEFNVIYAEIIRYSNLLDLSQAQTKEFGITIARLDTVAKIQSKILEIHDLITDKVDGSKGMGKKLGLSRAVDHSARMTIIPSIYNKRKFGTSQVGVRYVGVPLFHLIAMFSPFVIKYAHDFIDELYNNGYFGDLDINTITPFYDKTHIEEIIEKMEDPSFRVKDFETPLQSNGSKNIILEFTLHEKSGDRIVKKPLSNMEFFYIVLNTYIRITEEKYVLDTRYPIDSMLSAQPLSPVVTTLNPRLLKDVSVLGRRYEEFSFIDENLIKAFAIKNFETCSRISSSTAVGFNGDFDGDSIGLKPVLSEEANADCKRIQNTLLFNFDYGFNFRRAIGKCGGQSIYSLTRDKLHYEITKQISSSHPFIRYILALENGALDIDVFISYFRGFKKQKPELSLYDTTDITYNAKKITTTLGRLILNRVLFGELWNNPHFHYINQFITEGDLGVEFRYVAQLKIEKKTNVDLNHIIDLYQEMTLRLSTLINASVSSNMLDPNKEFTKIRDSILDAGYKKYLETNDVADYMDAENKAIEAAKEYYKDNPMYQLYISKNKAKWDNDFKQLCIAQGATQDIVTGRVNIVRTALVDGTSNTDMIGQINMGMESAGARGILTARGGALFKELADSGQTIYGIDHDCGSTKGVIVNTKEKWDLINKYALVNKKSILITLENVDQFLGKPVEIRSPYHCHEKNGNYCSHCLGRTPFELTGEKKVALGMFITEIGNGVLNMYMKAVHTAGASLNHIKDLNEYIYPKPKTSLFYTKHDPIEKVDKIYCTEDMEWRVPAAAVTKVGTTYMVLAHGSVIVGSDTKTSHAFVLGTEVSTNPIEVLNPDSKSNDIDKHYILKYKKDTPIINTTSTFKKEDTVYKMLYLFIKGNVSSLVPLETHKITLINAFNTNKRITASDISYDILLSTLARSKKDISKPAREFDDELEYEFVSLSDITMMGGTFSSCFGPDGSRGRFVSGAKTETEQNLKHSPYEESIRM